MVAAWTQVHATFFGAPAQHPQHLNPTFVASSGCAVAAGCVTGSGESAPPTVTLPDGASPCAGSGPGAACASGNPAIASVPGLASLPVGTQPCPSTTSKSLPLSAASCSDTSFESGFPGGPDSEHGPPLGVALSSDGTTLTSGHQVLLTATATGSVSATGGAIEIFDLTSATVVGACGEGSTCQVAYSADGGTHVFAAFFTTPTALIPAAGAGVESNILDVTWLKTSIAASTLLATPGQRVVLTATSAADVAGTGRWLEIYDLTTHSRLTYCGKGTECTTSISASDAAVHQIVAHVSGSPDSVSSPIYLTWLAVGLSASTLTQSTSGTVSLHATVNADLQGTTWQLGIYDGHGRLVGHTCNTGMTCSATVWVDGSSDPVFTAIVTQPGDVHALAGNVIARSAPVTPTHILWGVDSCKAFTSDPAASTGLYQQVAGMLGSPDFWGRYLTDTTCPGISQTEIAAAASRHMGILPIYDAYDCSAVSSYSTGLAYALRAVAAAQNLGIPRGRGLAIDIEPPGPYCPGAVNVDSGFVKGWFDGIHGSGYVPVYYGNGTAGSEFATAWCAATADAPIIASESYLWSFEPSLLGRFRRQTAPAFTPYAPGCTAVMGAWQYRISDGSDPDVDHDLALSSLSLWYPSSAGSCPEPGMQAGTQRFC